jgi:hypothetical protein
MPAPLDEPTDRCNILLFAADKAWLYRRYGHGWSAKVRDLVREHRKEQEQPQVIEWPTKSTP